MDKARRTTATLVYTYMLIVSMSYTEQEQPVPVIMERSFLRQLITVLVQSETEHNRLSGV